MSRPSAHILTATALLLLPACSDKGVDQAARLARIENRLDVLEKRSAGPRPNGPHGAARGRNAAGKA